MSNNKQWQPLDDDELNNNIKDIGCDNSTINNFFENIKIEARTIIYQDKDTNPF